MRAETGMKFVTVSAQEKHGFGVFELGATGLSAEGLQLSTVFQCLNGIIMLRLIKHTAQRQGTKKSVTCLSERQTTD